MFGSKQPPKQPANQKTRRHKGEGTPSRKEILDLQLISDENRGRDFELMWSTPGSVNNYCLNIKTAFGPVEPVWILWEDDGKETKMIWQYQTIDTDLINDCVCMADKSSAAAPALSAPTAQSSVNRQSLPSQPLSGQPLPGLSLPGQSLPGQSLPGQPLPGQPLPGQPLPGQPLPGQPLPGQPLPGLSLPGQPLPGQPQANAAPSASAPALQPRPAQDSVYPRESYGFAPPPAQPNAISPTMATAGPEPAQNRPSTELEGTLDHVKSATLINTIAGNKRTGKLEVRGEESVGSIYFVDGVPKHATTPSAYGDGAIRELVSWEKGIYRFTPNLTTEMRSVEGRLDAAITDGQTLLDQKRHLKRAGLSFESVLLRKHKLLSDSELRLMLMKGASIDFEFQKKIYEYLKHKRTFTDLLRDHPMDSTTWTALLFNFISCGLLEIKEPDTVKNAVLDFLGADKEHVRKLTDSFIRPETGIYSYEAMLFFMEYEFRRFEAYNFPLSLVLFEILRKRQAGDGSDLLTGPAANAAAMRINLIKRPLDTLGHFQTLEYLLLLPNTKGSSAAWLANRIYESLTATPLVPNLDRNTLAIAFGIASLPVDGDDLQSLVIAAREAKQNARNGTFPIVLSSGAKK